MRNWHWSAKVFHTCLLTIITFGMFWTNDARADDEASKYQKVLEKWSQRLPALQKTDTGETAEDIALIRSWIGQAQAFVASEKFEKIDPFLDRIESMVKFVKVRQERVKIEKAVEAAKASLARLNESVKLTKEEADEMLEKIKKLENK